MKKQILAIVFLISSVQTLRAQQRSVLQYLYEAISAHRSGTQSPTLVVGQ